MRDTMALPSGRGNLNRANGLSGNLGKTPVVDTQSVSGSRPKHSVRFSRKEAAIELRALAEAVRLIGDPSLNIRNRDPHQAMRFKERIAERLERLASEVQP
jgi:hypothetical protein